MSNDLKKKRGKLRVATCYYFMALMVDENDVHLYTTSQFPLTLSQGKSSVQSQQQWSYRWTGWVWEMTGWSSRLQEIIDHCRGIYRIYPNLTKENRRMSTCNRLVMPKFLPDHWCRLGLLPASKPMTRENRQLVTDEVVEVEDCRKITNHFTGIYRLYPNSIKENRRMSTCNRLELQTLGSQPVTTPKNLPDHWSKLSKLETARKIFQSQ